jgi:hypothetical protein
MPWSRPFYDPINPPKGKLLVTLQDAGTYITKLPKAEHEAPAWQAAMEALILRAAFRIVFEEFEVQPTKKRQRYKVEPYARLSDIMGLDLFPKPRTAKEMLAEQGLTMSLSADGTTPI